MTRTLITSSHPRRNSMWDSGSGMERKRLSAKSQNSHAGWHHECVWLNHQVGCTERSQKARTEPCPVVRRSVREELNCCGDPRARTGRKEVRAPVQCGYGVWQRSMLSSPTFRLTCWSRMKNLLDRVNYEKPVMCSFSYTDNFTRVADEERADQLGNQ